MARFFPFTPDGAYENDRTITKYRKIAVVKIYDRTLPLKMRKNRT